MKRSHGVDGARAHKISVLSRGERFQGVQGRAPRWGWEGWPAGQRPGGCEHTSTLAGSGRSCPPSRLPTAVVGSSPAETGPGAVTEGRGKWYGEDPLQALTSSGFFLFLTLRSLFPGWVEGEI